MVLENKPTAEEAAQSLMIEEVHALCEVIRTKWAALATIENLIVGKAALVAAEAPVAETFTPQQAGPSGLQTSTPGDNDWGYLIDSKGVLDASNVDWMLEKSVQGSTLCKYSGHWDKSVQFATYHQVKVMPTDMRGLEIFVADTAEILGSAGVAGATTAAVAHFCNLEGYETPFTTPRFSKIMQGIWNRYSKPVRPKKPFTRGNIIKFMTMSRTGSLMDWRAAFS
jgi:hypothetical protein